MDASVVVLPSRIAPGRSCVACRKRKIRCDRQQPCSYCIKLKVSCTYPGGDQEEKRQPAADILSKLERIELSLSRLEERVSGVAGLPTPDHPPESTHHASEGEKESRSSAPTSVRLIQDERDTRYLINSFWADLEDEDDQTEAGEFDGSTALASSAPANVGHEPLHHQAFIFNMSSLCSSLRQLHPRESRIFALWQAFMDNVDPLIKIVHIPITQRQMLRASQNLETIPPAIESLMFSIYFAAVTSIQCDVACRKFLDEDRQILLDRYRFGVEQALARANFISNPGLVTLQSLVLYLICARQTADRTYVWTMTGLAVRLATKLGLHHDPVALGLPPYLSELRRRLWWQICTLDVRIAEESYMDPLICEHDFDTKFPLNISDADLDINMTEPIKEASHRTDMLFSLTRIEITYAARKLAFSAKFGRSNDYKALSQQEKNDYIDQLQKGLQEKYLKSCDMKVPICFLAAIASRMVLTKMKLTINHSSREAITFARLSREQDINLVESSIEIIEYAHTLRSEEKYSRWVWLFQKYVEWDAVAFLLYSLDAAPALHLMERAWQAVSTFFQDWCDNVVAGDRRWKRLESLRAKAMDKQGLNHSASDGNISNDPVRLPLDSSLNETGVGSSLQAGLSYPHGQSTTHLDPSIATIGAMLPQDYLDWNFEATPDAMQGVANWEPNINEDALTSWL